MANRKLTQKLRRWLRIAPSTGVINTGGVPLQGPSKDEDASGGLKTAVLEAQQANLLREQIGRRVGGAMETIDQVTENVDRSYELWKPVLEKVKFFAVLIENLGDIHPYAKIASTVLLASVKVVTAQVERDKDMDELLEAMNDLYEFGIRARYLEDIDQVRKKLLKDMSLQTIQCAYFIRDQAKIQNFWLRTVSNAMRGSQVDGQMNDFTEAFKDIRRRFTERGVLESEIHLIKILKISSDIHTTIELANMTCFRDVGLDSSKCCLPGTRSQTLDGFAAWINDADQDAPRVRFLLGGAGTGKSSVAHSIGVYFHDLKRLGSFIRFDRSSQSDHPLSHVIRTIARDLANWDPSFRRALASVVHDNHELEISVDMAQQWEGLIIEPLKRVTLIGPVVVVIDAFDECSSPDSPERRLLLRLLSEGSKQLPPNFRVLITSRPDRDIKRVADRHANGQSHISHMVLDDNREEARRDVAVFLCHQLTPEDPDSDKPLEDVDIQLLADKSEGLFQWAATACRALLQKPGGRTLKERLISRLGLMLRGGPSSLDDLYRSILEGIFDSDDQATMERFHVVMSQILCASYPLSIESLEEIRRLSTRVSEDEVHLIVQELGSVLSGVYARTSPIRPHHTSFRDFLTDKSRSLKWFIDLAAGHNVMALGCFRVMNTHLVFNICRLESSHIRNRDVSDLDTRLSVVPASLLYATCNWKYHLAAAPLTDLQHELDKFLGEKLLFWFELLSLLRSVNGAAPSLETLLGVYDDSRSQTSKGLLRDAIAFIHRFANVIAQAASHVYVSALPFSPTLSEVRKAYLPSFSHLPIVKGIHGHWSQAHAVLSGHSHLVYAMIYSPDGRHIASGSRDGTVRVWDAETGETVHKLSCGSPVYRLAFSPDGRHIATVLDQMVSVWDSTTGDAVRELLCESEVWCVAYSPDGSRIVSGGADGRIWIWSSETFEMVQQVAHGQRTVLCITFSPNSQYVVSGSSDNTLQIKDAIAGQTAGRPLEGHIGRVTSVLVSLDGRQVVSGARDATIRIWDFETQETLKTISLSDQVWCLSLSPDGNCIVSGSRDGSVLIWDMETCRSVGGPFVGHTSSVYAVCFSPDKRHVASGSGDTTIRIWAAEEITRDSLVSSSPARSNVTALIFSPDGHRIISGSSDGTINVWDGDSGKSISSWKGHSDGVTRLTFSPNGGRFVSASDDNTIRVWDSSTLRPLGKPLRGHSDWILDVAYSPHGHRIVSSSADHTLRIWDAETFECVSGPLSGHHHWVRCVAWSPNGKYIASGSNDQTALVWDAEKGCPIGQPFKGHDSWVRSISWSEDSQCVMSSDDSDTIKFWDPMTQAPRGEPLHAGWLSVYSPDHRWILSGASTGTMQLWDAETRKPVGKPLSNPFGMIGALVFSPDGRRIASLTRGSKLGVVWDADTLLDPSGAHPSILNLKSTTRNLVEDLSVSRDGWVTDVDDNLIIWVPDEYRDSLSWRGILFVIPEQDHVVVDFARAYYGADWLKCYQENA